MCSGRCGSVKAPFPSFKIAVICTRSALFCDLGNVEVIDDGYFSNNPTVYAETFHASHGNAIARGIGRSKVRGVRMLNRVLWLCTVLLLSAAYVHADGIDPVIQVDEPQCKGTQVVTPGQIFNFSAGAANTPNAGGGCTGFVVASNPDIRGTAVTSLDIEAIAPNITNRSQVTCLSNTFGCQVNLLSGVLDIFLSCADCSGIAPGQVFSINLSDLLLIDGQRQPDTNGDGGFQTIPTGSWIPGQSFSAIADPSGGQPTTPFLTAPEPSSIFLLFTGVVAIAARRRIVKL